MLFLKNLASFWQPFLFMTAWNIATITQLYHHQPRWKILCPNRIPIKKHDSKKDMYICIFCRLTIINPTDLIVLSKMLWVQRFTERKFLWVSESQVSAHSNARIESLDTEVHRAVDISQVGKLDPVKKINWDFLLKFASSVFLSIPPPDRPPND